MDHASVAGMSSPDERCRALFFQQKTSYAFSQFCFQLATVCWVGGGKFPCLSFKRERSHTPNSVELGLLIPINLFTTFTRLAQGNACLEITVGLRQSPSPDNDTSGSFQRFRHWEMPESSLVALKVFKYL